jgi:hypothetical protein
MVQLSLNAWIDEQLSTLAVALEAISAVVLFLEVMVETVAFEDDYDNEDNNNDDSNNNTDIEIAVTMVMLQQRQQGIEVANGLLHRRKRVRLAWEEAYASIQRDYMGANAKFAGREFERIFRMTRPMVEELIQVCGCNRHLNNQPNNKNSMRPKNIGLWCFSCGFQGLLSDGREDNE